MNTINNSVFQALGEGFIKTEILEAAAEIVAAENPIQEAQAVSRFRNFVLIAAKGLEMQGAGVEPVRLDYDLSENERRAFDECQAHYDNQVSRTAVDRLHFGCEE